MQIWVSSHMWDFGGEQLPPSPIGIRRGGGESLVELLLNDSGGAAALRWPGESQITRVDLGGGPPYLDVGYQLCRHENTLLGRPGRRISRGVAAYLVGELSNQV
jgi:hypothetical protein